MMALDDGLLLALAGRYEIEREIGQGGMAVVYLARDVKHNRRVALKVLRPELANALGNERFLQEIAIAAPLVHPNILPIHDSGEAAGHLFYVMPYVDGLTLRQRLERERQLALDDVLVIVRQVAAALDHAHAHGVVHRDIKPENILLLGEHVLVADFGLAKAITRATSQPLTLLGTVVGTPEYMSPEQATPGDVVDPRSDIYSLACVTFEMIAGVPPFRGANAQAVIAHHVATPPPGVCEERSSCPPELDAAVRRGMAKVPADRFHTAGEFVRALGVGTPTPSSPPFASPAIAGPARRRWRPRASVLAGIALTAAAIGAGVWALGWGPLRRTPAVDESTYAVFPFRHDPRAKNLLLDGDGCARMLHTAMSRWKGIRLVDDMRVGDVWARGEPRTVADALDAAASLKAGTLAWGNVLMVGDSLEIRAVSYSVAHRDSTPRQFVLRVGPDAASLHAAFEVLADSIVAGDDRERAGAVGGTRDLRALDQFLAGRKALDSFDLHAAEQRFRQAIASDESYAPAHLWLARTLSWGGEAAPAAWASAAGRAVALTSKLNSKESMHASALLSLAQGRMSDACRRYDDLIAQDSADFAAWFGLGDCHARDSIVVRDARSPSGYAFRGSLYTAVAAYRRALMLVPSYHLAERGASFQRLTRRVLYTEESRSRRGVAAPPDTQTFIAFPSFAGDTLAFVPVPYRLSTAAATTPPPTERAAVRWSAETFQQIMAEWVTAFPARDDAQEGYASALEATSSVTGSSERLPEALAAARRALARSRTGDARTTRTAMVVRLLFKMDSLPAAHALVDSALATTRSPSPRQAGYLAALATLTGRARLAASLAARAASDSQHIPFVSSVGRRVDFPVPLTAGALELRVYASLGGPRDSLRSTLLRTARLVDVWVPPGGRAEARQSLFRYSFALAYDALAPVAPFAIAPGRDPLLAMHAALASGDTAAVRRLSQEFERLTSRFLPGTMGTDRLYNHATVLLALHDTTSAIDRLDVALSALPRVRSIITEVPPQAGAVGRAMILRAQLAAARGDRDAAQRWTRSASILWRSADPELRVPLEVLRAQTGIQQ